MEGRVQKEPALLGGRRLEKSRSNNVGSEKRYLEEGRGRTSSVGAGKKA